MTFTMRESCTGNENPQVIALTTILRLVNKYEALMAAFSTPPNYIKINRFPFSKSPTILYSFLLPLSPPSLTPATLNPAVQTLITNTPPSSTLLSALTETNISLV